MEGNTISSPADDSGEAPIERVKKHIAARIKSGEELLKLSADYKTLGSNYARWNDYNKVILDEIIPGIIPAYNKFFDIYNNRVRSSAGSGKFAINSIRENIGRAIEKLQIIYQRVELYQSQGIGPHSPDNPKQTKQVATQDVFVVHGHDNAMRESVALFLIKLELNPIILNEKASKGQTIIEKFEAHSNVNFAVILLSPDDEGKNIKERTELKNRARQNVILELGFFLSKLGRARVCALVKGSIEWPSDYSGVIWQQFDDHEAWQKKLAKELREAGIPFDKDKFLDA